MSLPGRDLAAVLHRSASVLAERLVTLEAEVDVDETRWPAYLETVHTLAVVAPVLTPGQRGELLTTDEMARRLGISSKTLLKHKSRGQIRPILQRGKLIRWRGDETVR